MNMKSNSAKSSEFYVRVSLFVCFGKTFSYFSLFVYLHLSIIFFLSISDVTSFYDTASFVQSTSDSTLVQTVLGFT
jgi:hypothetical protein